MKLNNLLALQRRATLACALWRLATIKRAAEIRKAGQLTLCRVVRGTVACRSSHLGEADFASHKLCDSEREHGKLISLGAANKLLNIFRCLDAAQSQVRGYAQ
jgi:hypothetical protein